VFAFNLRITSKNSSTREIIILSWKERELADMHIMNVSSEMMLASAIKRNKEDIWHNIHLLLAAVCVCNCLWRIAQVGTSDMGFDTYPDLTPATIVLHLTYTFSELMYERKIQGRTCFSCVYFILFYFLV
jgi:hypothetical protein